MYSLFIFKILLFGQTNKLSNQLLPFPGKTITSSTHKKGQRKAVYYDIIKENL